MQKKWDDINQIFFPDGVRSVYFGGRRVKKEDIQIERSFIEIVYSFSGHFIWASYI